MVRCDISTTQNDDGTIKCEGKKKGTAKCDKWTVTCDIWTAQFKDRTVKCENKKNKKKNNHQMWQKYCQMWEKK